MFAISQIGWIEGNEMDCGSGPMSGMQIAYGEIQGFRECRSGDMLKEDGLMEKCRGIVMRAAQAGCKIEMLHRPIPENWPTLGIDGSPF